MDFSRTDDGRIDQRYFGAQSFRRTAFAGDYTGEALMETLVERARALEIPYRENLFVSSLLVEDGRVRGAVGTDLETGEFVVIEADVVVLSAGATPASTADTPLETTKTPVTGRRSRFWPAGRSRTWSSCSFTRRGWSGLVTARWDGRLVTEAVRGEGGRLFNANGERFMERYSPDQMELDARDVVARAIGSEIAAGRGTDHGVFLDISHRDRSLVETRLPRMVERFETLGVDLAETPVEVSPTAHYGMGGVVVDDDGETDVDGLYAIGETMAGVHGANRLGGNSLAETIAYGAVTGEAIAERLNEGTDSQPQSGLYTIDALAEAHLGALEALATHEGTHDPEALLDELRELLWTHAGILRDGAGITAGRNALETIRRKAADLSVGSTTDRSFEFALNLGFGLVVADAILRSAEMRTESRGAHVRTDHPESDPSQRHNVVVRSDGVGEMSLSTDPVGTPSEAVRDALEAGYTLDYHQLE